MWVNSCIMYSNFTKLEKWATHLALCSLTSIMVSLRCTVPFIQWSVIWCQSVANTWYLWYCVSPSCVYWRSRWRTDDISAVRQVSVVLPIMWHPSSIIILDWFPLWNEGLLTLANSYCSIDLMVNIMLFF